ncbi:pilus assembly protein TadG-related protein [Seohaeicola saemankumensis]|uniref:Pilus assembly protein TadG-related protein n=1 Tax=Seohaeicola saemankumensis TaxID=481181 RepID=A0ABW3T8A0_9RHOB
MVTSANTADGTGDIVKDGGTAASCQLDATNRRVCLALFRRDEDGALVIFAAFMLMMILLVGSLGVDLMRFEMERAKLQSTLDRAVLAAADIDQTLKPEDVVNEYFTKSGLGGTVTGVKVSEGLGYRSVSATAQKSVKTVLIHMLGIDTLTTPAAGAAEERVDSVEISLVLDVSGSMATNNRITNLRSAGHDFIDAVFANAAQNKVSLSIVPYNGQVNVGPDLIDKYNITDRHSDTFCVDLPASVYTSAALSRSLPMPQHVFADTYNSSNTSSSYNTSNMSPSSSNRWCDANPVNRIRVHSNNITQLKGHITSLQPVGATSIDAGMRWGSALLDPSARSVVSDLVTEKVVITPFAGRPLDYNDAEVLKVIVLMTDGEHWPNEYVNDGFRSGPSTIYRNTADNRYSIFHAGVNGANKFWIPHNSSWSQVPWGGSVTQVCTGSWWNRTCTQNLSNGSAILLDWQTVWKELRVQWVANQLYRRALGGDLNTWVDMLRTREGTVMNPGPHEVTTMNNRLLYLCTKMKEKGVVIYTVAFEAPSMGQSLLRDCASSPNHAFDVDGLEIASAFSSIATSIRKLRLTQ